MNRRAARDCEPLFRRCGYGPVQSSDQHDDHVRRAVEAAFRIEEAANDINSTLRGDFVFGVGDRHRDRPGARDQMGSTNCDDYTVLGDAINIAARLQEKAASGEI